MTTIAKTFSTSGTISKSATLSARYNQFIKKLEFSHYFVIATCLLVSSCLGSVTAMKIFENHAPDWQFVVGLGFTMANLVACIAQAPTKWVVNLFAASVLVNSLLLVLNIL